MRDPAYLVVKTGLLDHRDKDVVSLTGNLNSFLGNIAENANGNSRTGEGVAPDKRLMDAKLATNFLVLFSAIEDKIQNIRISLPSLHP